MTVLAVGDSIVHAEDSWAAWLARAMDLPLRRISANGARSGDVLEQVSSLGDERYAVACLSVGTNDVLFDWDPAVFRQRLLTLVAAADGAGERVVVPTISRGLGRFPGSGPSLSRRVAQANAAITACGAVVIAGADLVGPRWQQADRVHPTRAGQLRLADRAAAALGVEPAPSTLLSDRMVLDRRLYYRVAAGQAPRRIAKRLLRRPFYR